MLVGVDFDNTIVCYDQLFHQIAMRQGLIPPEVPLTKGNIREHLRQCGKEDAWTELQGYVYGACMHDALPFPGVMDFFARCRQLGVTVCIISHKTRYPFQGPTYDLHRAAHEWLENHGFYDPSGIGLLPSRVYFELTKRKKLDRIAKVGCSHFIDDLPEFLGEPGFPAGVERILFDPNGHHPISYSFHRAASWAEIGKSIVW